MTSLQDTLFCPACWKDFGTDAWKGIGSKMGARGEEAPDWRAVAQAFRDATAHEDEGDFSSALELAQNAYNKAIRCERPNEAVPEIFLSGYNAGTAPGEKR